MNVIFQYLVMRGYPVLFASVFARQRSLPVPANLFLIAAGALAGSRRLTLSILLALAIIACLRADIVGNSPGLAFTVVLLALPNAGPSGLLPVGCQLFRQRGCVAG